MSNNNQLTPQRPTRETKKEEGIPTDRITPSSNQETMVIGDAPYTSAVAGSAVTYPTRLAPSNLFNGFPDGGVFNHDTTMQFTGGKLHAFQQQPSPFPPYGYPPYPPPMQHARPPHQQQHAHTPPLPPGPLHQQYTQRHAPDPRPSSPLSFPCNPPNIDSGQASVFYLPPTHGGAPPPGPQNLPDMAVLVHRVDLVDSLCNVDAEWAQQQAASPSFSPAAAGSSSPATSLPSSIPSFAPYRYEPPLPLSATNDDAQNGDHKKIVAYKIPPHLQDDLHPCLRSRTNWRQIPVVDMTTPCPYTNPSLTKYWNQRRRLFSRFDHGIQLDEEGWFSVTPEQIADHVAGRLVQMSGGQNITILDAFCGCAGNAIAFAKHPNIRVVAVDVDRKKLRNAAQNAAIYQIPPNRLCFVECNVLFLLEHCFHSGEYILDQPISSPEAAAKLMAAMPPPTSTEMACGYHIGGIDLLPRTLNAVFMDPPWGGVDYEVFGKNGYDLQHNMRIEKPCTQNALTTAPGTGGDGLNDAFFDSFLTEPRNKQERKAQFNATLDENNCVNGCQLLALAAAATATRWVLYDVPRNTSRTSLGKAALQAGYRGHCKLEEHYLNGRLKTSTAYFGCDWMAVQQRLPLSHHAHLGMAQTPERVRGGDS